jgi:thioredoxin 1
MWQFFRRLAVVALLLISTAIGCSVQPPPPPVDVAEVEAELESDFAVAIQNTPTVLVKFGASWCGPCVRLDKELENLKASLDSDTKIISVDIDKDRKLASTFEVGAIPHMILFKAGKAVDQKIGYHSAEEVADWMGVQTGRISSSSGSLGPARIQSNPFVSDL